MSEVRVASDIVSKVCEQLSEDRTLATGEVMAAAALVAVTAGLNDDQAVQALRCGLKVIRAADGKGLNS